jgi:hypothetical protein
MSQINTHILTKLNGSIVTRSAKPADFPYNADELALVEMTEEMLAQVYTVSEDETNIIDFTATTYNFDSASWDIQYFTPNAIDPATLKLDELNKAKRTAEQYASIDDLPQSIIDIIASHIDTLNSINITSENCADTIIPRLIF